MTDVESLTATEPVALDVVPPPAPRPCRLGFLGTGWIGRNRLDALAASGIAEVSAVTDASPSAAEDAARSTGAAVIRDFETLLECDLDGIVIATPSALHAEQSIAALERGFAVFCQKPLARTAAEARRVLFAAESADRLLGVDLSYRHLEASRRIRELWEGGELGEVYAAELVFHNAYGPDKPWFHDRKLSGGGCLIDLGTHLVDLALWMLDYPVVERVSGRLFREGRPFVSSFGGVEDFATARLDLSTGATVNVACSWKLSMGCDARIEAWFHGSRASACLRNVAGSFHDFESELLHGTRRHVLTRPPDPWGGRAAVAWARQLCRSNRFDPEIEGILHTCRVLDTLYAS